VSEQGGELRSARLTVDGCELFMRFASSPGHAGLLPIVLVHGLSVSSRYMVPVGRRLAPQRDLYAPDLPGFGLSEKPTRPLTIPELADALLAWMDAVGIGRAVMLGNSMGCQIIADVGARRPERLAAAVFVGPTADRRARSVLGHAWRLLRDLRHESLASIVTQGSDYLRFGPLRTLATLRHALADPIERKLPLLRAPALLVRGGNDPIAPQPWLEELAALIPESELLVIPGGPHALNYERPDELAAAVLDFLARHPQIAGVGS
jgi:2-hydroxy-6-oxonona-2,4-dienedioate hydrolase